jgi:CheY-like chemotaxis protein
MRELAAWRGGPMKVMVVDDNTDAATSLGMLVELLGHDVRTAFGGEEALEVAGAFHPEVVLMDLGMPGMDGFEACRQMRDQPWGTKMTVVAVTGWGQAEARRQTTLAGFDQHLVKPVSPALIASTLQELAAHEADREEGNAVLR